MTKSFRDVMTTKAQGLQHRRGQAGGLPAKMMKDENVGFAPIVEGDRLVGTVTDRDIAVKAVAAG
jgi:predicted transcriptional regulator